MYIVYVLYSDKIKRYYVGSTSNIKDRLSRHNSGRSKYTKRGVPWRLITSFESNTRSEAMMLEKKIKKRGIARYLSDIKFGV